MVMGGLEGSSNGGKFFGEEDECVVRLTILTFPFLGYKLNWCGE